MFNFLMSWNAEAWNTGVYDFERNRVAVEYTSDELRERYLHLTPEAIEELKTFPTIFAVEAEEVESRLGFITDIEATDTNVRVRFEFDPNLPPLPSGALRSMKTDFKFGRLQMTRTHWAVKEEPLWDILFRHDYLTEAQLQMALHRFEGLDLDEDEVTPAAIEPIPVDQGSTRIFIVHGHNDVAKLETANFVSSLGLEPIILHMQASQGQTIIEKIERYSDVKFAIVLYTECDEGRTRGTLEPRWRARQNVVFEHGYLIGKLSRANVVPLVAGNVETPGDISGVVYVTMDEQGAWKDQVKREIESAGYQINS